jgi:hypothetical protein
MHWLACVASHASVLTKRATIGTYRLGTVLRQRIQQPNEHTLRLQGPSASPSHRRLAHRSVTGQAVSVSDTATTSLHPGTLGLDATLRHDSHDVVSPHAQRCSVSRTACHSAVRPPHGRGPSDADAARGSRRGVCPSEQRGAGECIADTFESVFALVFISGGRRQHHATPHTRTCAV